MKLEHWQRVWLTKAIHELGVIHEVNHVLQTTRSISYTLYLIGTVVMVSKEGPGGREEGKEERREINHKTCIKHLS